MLYWEAWGDANNPTLLFLHGFMGSGRDWQPVISLLIGSFHCVTVDLPWHGKSAGVPESQEAFAWTAGQIADIAREHNAVALVGYSMGGRMALWTAVHHSDVCHHLILESANPGLREGREARQVWDEQIAMKLERMPFVQFLDEWYQLSLFDSLRVHPAFDGMVAQRLENHPNRLAMAMRRLGTGSMQSLWDEWGQLKAKTTVIVGQLDDKYCDIGYEMVQVRESCNFVILDDVGHNVHLEAPEEFVKKVLPQNHSKPKVAP